MDMQVSVTAGSHELGLAWSYGLSWSLCLVPSVMGLQ